MLRVPWGVVKCSLLETTQVRVANLHLLTTKVSRTTIKSHLSAMVMRECKQRADSLNKELPKC